MRKEPEIKYTTSIYGTGRHWAAMQRSRKRLQIFGDLRTFNQKDETRPEPCSSDADDISAPVLNSRGWAIAFPDDDVLCDYLYLFEDTKVPVTEAKSYIGFQNKSITAYCNFAEIQILPDPVYGLMKFIFLKNLYSLSSALRCDFTDAAANDDNNAMEHFGYDPGGYFNPVIGGNVCHIFGGTDNSIPLKTNENNNTIIAGNGNIFGNNNTILYGNGNILGDNNSILPMYPGECTIGYSNIEEKDASHFNWWRYLRRTKRRFINE